MFDSINMVFAMTPQGGSGDSGSIFPMLFMFGGVILVMYFLMIRPQQKRQKEHQKLLGSLKRGQKVVTNSGIHATVEEVKEKTLVLRISDNVKITFEKNAITSIQ